MAWFSTFKTVNHLSFLILPIVIFGIFLYPLFLNLFPLALYLSLKATEDSTKLAITEIEETKFFLSFRRLASLSYDLLAHGVASPSFCVLDGSCNRPMKVEIFPTKHYPA